MFMSLRVPLIIKLLQAPNSELSASNSTVNKTNTVQDGETIK